MSSFRTRMKTQSRQGARPPSAQRMTVQGCSQAESQRRHDAEAPTPDAKLNVSASPIDRVDDLGDTTVPTSAPITDPDHLGLASWGLGGSASEAEPR